IAYTFAPNVALGGFILAYNLDSGASRLILESNLTGATSASGSFVFPSGIWGGGDGFLYLADSSLVVYRIAVSNGEVQPIFGRARYHGWVDGTASDARFRGPRAIWGDGTNLFVADEYILRMASLTTQAVTTLAGTGVRTVTASDTPNHPLTLGYGL